jgi:hypothetical protein
VGERDHSVLQREFMDYFRSRRGELKTHVFVAQRVQVSKTRFRVPDICVSVGEDPQDRVARTQERIDDYLKFGLAYVRSSIPPTAASGSIPPRAAAKSKTASWQPRIPR